jgi:cystathionine beta-lyase
LEDLFREERLICTHLGDEYSNFNGAVVPPIYENSLFVFEKFEDLLKAFENEKDHYLYTRGKNPTVEILEKKLAALEHGEECKVFSSGMAAISSAMITFLGQGDHILFVSNIYGPALKYVNYIKKFGIEHDVVYDVDVESIEKNIKPNTKVIYLESPATTTLKMLDLKPVADLAKSRGIVTMIDNTWATPLFQRPLDHGIDISIHSCSKYIGGHSDVIAGAIISRKTIIDKIFYHEFQLHGGAIGPFEAWLLLRGLRTLPVRMEKHQESALKVAKFLEGHSKVKRVNYPGLESSPDYELGKKYLSGYSGLISFELESEDFDDLKKVINSCRIFKIGVSWGGFESLILSPANGNNAAELRSKGIAPSLIRISVGLESVDTLIEDLDGALGGI